MKLEGESIGRDGELKKENGSEYYISLYACIKCLKIEMHYKKFKKTTFRLDYFIF